MILVVADTSPIHYLVLIQAVDVLSRLYDRIVLPKAVLAELTHQHAPTVVRNWATALPPWVEIKSASYVELANILDPGEAEAIALAQELRADSLLLDEAEARQEAIRLGLRVSGTVGVLEKAAERDMIDLRDAFERLLQTHFYIAPELLRQALQRDAARRAQKSRDSDLQQ